jgi:hypothetical protein
MAKQTIGIGSSANDGTGDPLRTAFDKVNDNFDELYGGLSYPPAVAGRWYALMDFPHTILQNSVPSADRIYYTPFIINKTITLSDLGTWISTVSAGGFLALAIYAADGTTGFPSGTPLASTGDISTASTGFASADITGSNVTLTPGIYWAANWQTGSARQVTFSHTGTLNLSSFLIGSSTSAAVINATTSTGFVFHSDETFNSSAWPNATDEALTSQNAALRGVLLIGLAV